MVVPGDPATSPTWWTIDSATGVTRSILDPGLGGAVPAGRPDSRLRTFDSSYTHGGGARLPQQAPMTRPAGGFRGPTPATCRAGDSTGYVALTSCISIPVSEARWLLAFELATIAVFAYYVLR